MDKESAMKDIMKAIALIGVMLIIAVSGCVSSENGDTQLPNPAAVYCEDRNGILEIYETDEGQSGYCRLPDGRVCEEWAFFRSEGRECSTPPEEVEKIYTEEESEEIARQFVVSSPTYQFDGSGIEHLETVQARCPQCWVFRFTFDSSHAGYGDRSTMIVAQVITPHNATVAVEKGEVVSAILDDFWDMKEQRVIGD